MTANELFRAGRLADAIQTLGNELRDRPADRQRRTFLFELLCIAGDYSRAEKHLNILADASEDAKVGALVYRSALFAERQRNAFFEEKKYESGDQPELEARPGKLNGASFNTIEDADPRVGARLEMFVAGEYLWIPFAHVASLRMEAPRRLRDTLWPVAEVTGGPALKSQDFGQVLLPALYPLSWRSERESVKLGRETDWGGPDGEVPFGQKLLVLDGETVVPLLEVRTLEFDAGEPERNDAAAIQEA
jgi:type VI secretion system protein ImpE